MNEPMYIMNGQVLKEISRVYCLQAIYMQPWKSCLNVHNREIRESSLILAKS